MDTTTQTPTAPSTATAGPDCAPLTGSVTLAEGRYENGKGAWLEVIDVQMPGYPKYDGGATGVTIKWGNQRAFVLARDEAHFWSQWPYSLCAPSQNTEVRDTGDGEPS